MTTHPNRFDSTAESLKPQESISRSRYDLAGVRQDREKSAQALFSRAHVSTDHHRMHLMMEALRRLHVPNSMGAPLLFFATRDELRTSDPLTHAWQDGNGRSVRLI